MLKSLRIDNFALIDKATIEFTDGFTVITGETGSGKSILLNALNLILGERANFSVIGNRKDKSVVEAEIDISGFGLQGFFELHELDFFETSIVRREIYKQGRSRAFINDVPVQLSVLKDFASRLIHIHSQYNTLELKDANFQMEVLDILAGTIELRHEFTKGYNEYNALALELKNKSELLRNLSSQSDYNLFQLQELEKLDLENVDYNEVQQDFKRFENADELKATLSAIFGSLSDENSVIDQLNHLVALMEKNVDYGSFKENSSRINAVLVELRDIAEDAEQQLDSFEVDPVKLASLSAKLDEYNNLLFKHKKSNQEDLMQLKQELAEASDSDGVLSSRVEELKSLLTEKEIALKEKGEKLDAARLKCIPGIEKTIQDALEELKLSDTKLIFKLNKAEGFTKVGTSSLQMLFSPNAGFEPVPIHNAASGGELSRLMLALQNLISQKIKLQTILFDEIDTGVSGDVAQKIGNTLKQMGQGMQVIAITHLPQVAAKGGQHLFVSKSILDGVTATRVTELRDESRVEEVARLMSGDEINEAAILNAKSLMT